MNQANEDYLAGLFTSAQLVPVPEVFTGTSSDIRPPESDAILVLADSIEHVVGPLHRATVKILVSSPTDNRTQQTPRPMSSSVSAPSPVPYEDPLAEIIRRGLDLIEALPPEERQQIARSISDTPLGSEPEA